MSLSIGFDGPVVGQFQCNRWAVRLDAGLRTPEDVPYLGMVERDRYYLTLECPGCQRTAQTRVSESGDPANEGRDFRMRQIPDGFILQMHGASPEEAVIVCTKCGSRVKTYV